MSNLKTLWRYFQHRKYHGDRMKTIVSLLESYSEDLRYAASDGVECCNFRTSGTPYFDSYEQMMEYIKGINETIRDIKENDDVDM